uniref:Uncharacterized protein n=1 Tax=Ascaris lumbricoides TaxID=6252 RepID=A0A0M3HXS2_ASCLU
MCAVFDDLPTMYIVLLSSHHDIHFDGCPSLKVPLNSCAQHWAERVVTRYTRPLYSSSRASGKTTVQI